MRRHLRQHAQQLNIKTTHLASLTAVFHPKKRPRRPAMNRSHLPVMDVDEDNNLAGPGGQADDSEVVPEASTSRLRDSGTDDSNNSNSDEASEGMMEDLEDLDSDEFQSDDDVGRCETGEGRGMLDFELGAARAGNVHRRDEILTKD